MTSDDSLALPAFELDCRDWFVERPETSDPADDPVVAVLSTLVMDDDVQEAVGSLRIGLLDAQDDLTELAARPVRPGAAAHEVLDVDPEPGTRRYVMPSPTSSGRRQLALVAEFVVPLDRTAELDRRVEALMSSFRWQAA